jgi:hypothetical protein
MKTLYLVLLGISIFLFLVDAFTRNGAPSRRGGTYTIELQSLALAVGFLVWFIQIAHSM